MDINELKDLYQSTYSRDKFFIGGDWVKPDSKKLIEIISPNTEGKIGEVPDANSQDIDTAVQAAKRAFEDRAGWSSWTVSERANLMRKFADILEARHQELSILYAHELGRPYKGSFSRPNRAAELLRYYAGLAEELELEQMRPIPKLQIPYGSVKHTSVKLESRGVTAVIVPYNGTLEMGMFKMGPTLALGGTLVLKPSPQSPLEGYIFAEAALEAGIPDGVINVLAGSREAGEALVSHKDIAIVGFTGSTATGRAIAKTCAETFTPVVLELGGKSAAVLLDDVDLESFTQSLPYLGFTFTGQNCFIHSRIIVPEKRYDEILEAIIESVASIKIGDPFDEATQNGPLISESHRNKVEEYIASGISEGAKIAFGGDRPKDLQKGWYLNPTVFTEAKSHMRISQEEIFGPVIAVYKVKDAQEAIDTANNSDFGLAGSVWGVDETRTRLVADQIDTGTIGVNCFGFNTAAPFAGRKNSGMGTELGLEGFLAYAKYKATHYSH
jgi:acyl-CoA reductase-like NAD-dependent aldehyde dehydrogenase